MKQPMVDIYPALSLTSFQAESREEFLDPEPPKYQTSRNTVFTLQNHFKILHLHLSWAFYNAMIYWPKC